MKQKNLSIIAFIAFYLSIASILGLNSFGYLDPDFGWHLKVGENIAKTMAVPSDQIYMWSLEGQNWVDHEWLSNLLTYFLWQQGGYIAISLFFILLPLLGLILLNRHVFTHYLKNGLERSVFCAIELGALMGCLPHFGIRLQEFAFVFFIILLIQIDRFRTDAKIKHIVWLPLLLLVWAYLHGSYLIGVAVTLGWLIYELLLYFWPWMKKILNEHSVSKKQIILLTSIVIIAVGTTFITPYGTKLYAFLSDYASNRYYMSHIQEWRSPFKSPFRYDQIIYTLLVVIFSCGAMFSLKKFPKLWQGVLLIMLLLMSARSVRHFPLWTVASLLFVVPLIIAPAFAKRRIPYPRTCFAVVMLCLLAISYSSYSSTSFTNDPFNSYCNKYPCAAIQFLREHPEYQKLRIFNNYGWGGYIIGVWPEQRLFIDGRLPQYPFNNRTILEEYNDFFNKDLLAKKLEEHKIEMVVFKPRGDDYKPDFIERFIFVRTEQSYKNELIDYLNANSSVWKIVFEDSVAKIWVKQ